MNSNAKSSNVLSARAILLFGFLFAVILFIICVIARPESLGHNDGLSYFGALWWTVVPYTLAFLTYSICCFIAARKINAKSNSSKVIKIFLIAMSLLLIGLIITPHTVINSIHKVFGSTLFASQLLLSLYLLYKNGMNYFIFILILIMFTSGIFSAAYLTSASGFMIQAQIIYQIAFIAVLYYYLGLIKKLK
jgi:hypothetical protein